MSAGYTVGIDSGKIKTGKEFLMLCARAFGACVEIRDEPLLVQIPERFESTDCYTELIARSRNKIAELQSLSKNEIRERMDKSRRNIEQSYLERIEAARKTKEKYANILEEVERWNPPTPKHEELKRFALNQIRITYDDINVKMPDSISKEFDVSEEEWREAMVSSIEDDIHRYKEYRQRDIDATKTRNEWIAILRESLEQMQ